MNQSAKATDTTVRLENESQELEMIYGYGEIAVAQADGRLVYDDLENGDGLENAIW